MELLLLPEFPTQISSPALEFIYAGLTLSADCLKIRYTSAASDRAWFRPLPGLSLILPAVLVVSDFKFIYGFLLVIVNIYFHKMQRRGLHAAFKFQRIPAAAGGEFWHTNFLDI